MGLPTINNCIRIQPLRSRSPTGVQVLMERFFMANVAYILLALRLRERYNKAK